jgi:hypothetical protein
MPTALYTVITGSYDAVKQLQVVMPGVECKGEVMQIPSEVWQGRIE